MKLLTIMESLRAQARRMTEDENSHADEIAIEIHHAKTETSIRNIYEREGLTELEEHEFVEVILGRLSALRRTTMN